MSKKHRVKYRQTCFRARREFKAEMQKALEKYHNKLEEAYLELQKDMGWRKREVVEDEE